MFFVKTTEIDWIEADRNYVRLHVGKAAHTIRERISHLEETLDPRLFARIHRSTIVNLNRVREMQQWFSGDYVVILEDGTRLRLSRHYRDRVEKQVGVLSPEWIATIPPCWRDRAAGRRRIQHVRDTRPPLSRTPSWQSQLVHLLVRARMRPHALKPIDPLVGARRHGPAAMCHVG